MGNAIDCRVFLPPDPSTYDLRSNNLSFVNDTIPVFYYRHPGSRFTILFSHGNGEDIGCMADWLSSMRTYLKADFVAYDYPGYGLYGQTHPDPSVKNTIYSETGTYQAAEQVYRWLVEEEGVAPNRIILFGRSLGSGPTTHLAQKLSLLGRKSRGKPPDLRGMGMGNKMTAPSGACSRDGSFEVEYSEGLPAGMVLQSPLSSAFRCVSNILGGAPGDRFCNINKIADVDFPILLLHGTADEVVPFFHSEQLQRTARTLHHLEIFEGGGHNDLEERYTDQFVASIRSFVEHLATQPTTRGGKLVTDRTYSGGTFTAVEQPTTAEATNGDSDCYDRYATTDTFSGPQSTRN